MGLKKWAWNSNIKKQHTGLDHMSLYRKYREKNPSTQEDLASTLDTPALERCDLNFTSTTFWPIHLTYIPKNIAREEVISFFAILDRVRKVEIDVAADGRVYSDAYLHVHAANISSSLPISVFWRAISHECKEPVRQYSNFLKIYMSLFSLHGKTLYRNKPAQ